MVVPDARRCGGLRTTRLRAAAPSAFTRTADSIKRILLPFSRTVVASPVVWCLGVCVWSEPVCWRVQVYRLVSCCRAILTGEAGASCEYHIVGPVLPETTRSQKLRKNQPNIILLINDEHTRLTAESTQENIPTTHKCLTNKTNKLIWKQDSNKVNNNAQ
jgi:hypothetical protein